MQIIKFFTFTILCFSYSDSEKVTQFLCPQPYGYFAHEDCAKFWYCFNNVSKEIECPKPLLFNGIYKVCDWYLNVDCNGSTPTPTQITIFTTINGVTDLTSTQTITTIIFSSTVSKSSTTASDYKTMSEDLMTTTEEPTTQMTDFWTPTTSKIPQNHCSGAHNLISHENCTKFWWKFQGIIKEISCDSGLAWNDWSKRCDKQSFSECFKSKFNQI